MTTLTRRSFLTGIAAVPAGAAAARTAFAQRSSSEPTEVDVCILFALDVSRSIDEEDELLQRLGYVQAFRSPEVIKAITGGTLGRIACAVVQWSGVHRQRVTVPWTVISHEADALAFADAIWRQERISSVETYITGALRFSIMELQRAQKMVKPLYGSLLNVSGDGADSYSHDYLKRARDEAVAAGITINGIPVTTGGNWHSNSRQPITSANLTEYYRDHVIGGPGAFVVEAEGYGDLGRALIRKLVLEIANARDLAASRNG